MNSVKYVINKLPKHKDKYLSYMAMSELKKICTFHESFPEYEPTLLVSLNEMARHLGVKNIYVKDESYRFGLNAFKVLGGSFAMAKYISKALGYENEVLSFKELASEELKEKFGQVTFFTATDGNHGRGVAWSARRLGQKAVVHMPYGTTKARLEHIENEGALVDILDMNYDDCEELRRVLELYENSEVLLFSTEGDTDPERYKRILYGD